MKLTRFCKPKVNLAGLSKIKQEKSDVEKKESSSVVIPAIVSPAKQIEAPLSPVKTVDNNCVPVNNSSTNNINNSSENNIDESIVETPIVKLNPDSVEIIDLPKELEGQVSFVENGLPSCDIDEAPKVRLFEDKKREIVRRAPYKPNIQNDKPLDKSTVMLKDLIHWVPSHNPPPKYRQKRQDSDKTTKPLLNDANSSPLIHNSIKQAVDESPEPLDEPENSDTESSQPGAVPQLKLDSEGNIILDESSLLVKSALPDFKKLNFLEEDASDLNITCRSFRNNKGRSRRWTEKEVLHFYKALSTIGTDFTSMSNMFKDREREELKKKFKREEKKNPHLIDRALKSRRSYDLSMFNMTSSEDEAEEKPVKKPPRKRKLKSQNNRKPNGVYYDESDEESRPLKKAHLADNDSLKKQIDDSIKSVLARINKQQDSWMDKTEVYRNVPDETHDHVKSFINATAYATTKFDSHDHRDNFHYNNLIL